MEDREALIRRLEAAVYVAREAGMSRDEILDVVEQGMTAAEEARPKAPEMLAEYRRRFGHAA